MNEDATGAANQLFNFNYTLAGFSGMVNQPGETETLIIALYTPETVKEAKLQVVEAGEGVRIGPGAQMEVVPLETVHAR